MPNQDLIDYENAQIVALNALISQKEQYKVSLDNAIVSQEEQITYLNNEKTIADTQIAGFNDSISKINQIIAILEA